MKERTKQLGIGLVYEQLRQFLCEYKETERFNQAPPDAPETCPVAYTSRRLLEIWWTACTLLQGERELLEKMERILAETVYFTREYEQPGVVRRWKQLNPNLLFFEAAFDFMEESPELYEQMRMGLLPIRPACLPDQSWCRRRDAYFAAARGRLSREGRRWSRDLVFQEELCRTLDLVFRKDFGNFEPVVEAG